MLKALRVFHRAHLALTAVVVAQAKGIEGCCEESGLHLIGSIHSDHQSAGQQDVSNADSACDERQSHC